MPRIRVTHEIRRNASILKLSTHAPSTTYQSLDVSVLLARVFLLLRLCGPLLQVVSTSWIPHTITSSRTVTTLCLSLLNIPLLHAVLSLHLLAFTHPAPETDSSHIATGGRRSSSSHADTLGYLDLCYLCFRASSASWEDNMTIPICCA